MCSQWIRLLVVGAIFEIVLIASPLAAQNQPGQQGNPARQAPFVLSPQEEAQVEHVLKAWEQRSHKVRTVGYKFDRFRYDPVWGPKTEEGRIGALTDIGNLWYAAPDRASYSVPEGDRQERWVSNGKAIFQYDFRRRQVFEHQLSPELRGQAVATAPLALLLSVSTSPLRQRFFVRVTRTDPQKQETWLEAYPRFAYDATRLDHVEIILASATLEPRALQFHYRNEVREVYVLSAINPADRQSPQENPFDARIPAGWQRVAEERPPNKPVSSFLSQWWVKLLLPVQIDTE